ncbi:MAG: hypothetical protein AAF738_05930 [Bacteroidota bacterium]
MKISAQRALELLSEGISISDHDVIVTQALDAVQAFQLRKNGIAVPDHLITYHDEDLEYDEDFDGANWEKLPQAVDERLLDTMHFLSLTDEERKWITLNKINLDVLLSQLLKNYIHTTQMISKTR